MQKAPSSLAALAMAWMFLYGAVGTGLVGPNRTAIEREFGLSHAGFGAAYAVIQVLCSLAVLTAATRSRRFDRGAALTFSLLLQTLGFAGVFLVRQPVGLAVGWTLVTLGVVLGFVSNSISAGLWPDNPRRGVLLLHGFDGSGKVAGPVLAALCLGIGWRWSFLTVGVMTAGLLVLSLTVRKRVPTKSPSPKELLDVSGKTPPMLGYVLLPFALMTGANVSFATLVPAYCQKVWGQDARAASLLLSVHLAGLALGRFLLFGAGRRFSPHGVIRLCLALGLFILLPLVGKSLPLLALSLFGVGGMFAGIWPTYYAQVSRSFAHAPHRLDYGSALGSNTGSAACVLFSSLIAQRSLYGALLFGPAVMGLFGLIYFGSPLQQIGLESDE